MQGTKWLHSNHPSCHAPPTPAGPLPIRLGSFVAPTIDEYEKVKSFQVPWTVNCIALHFLSAVAKDDVCPDHPPPPAGTPRIGRGVFFAPAHAAGIDFRGFFS